MLYSIIIKKYQGEKRPYIGTRLIRNVIRNTNNPFVVGWPGYIGKTKTNIDSFYKELNPFYPNQLDGFFYKPLSIVTLPIGVTNEDYMNMVFGGYVLPQPRLNDHSKILVIFETGSDVATQKCDLFACGHVRAILIGSSNQSFNTYCVSPTPRGEADVLLLDIDSDCNSDLQNLLHYLGDDSKNSVLENRNLFIAKEIDGIVHDSLDEIVKKIMGYI